MGKTLTLIGSIILCFLVIQFIGIFDIISILHIFFRALMMPNVCTTDPPATNSKEYCDLI